MHALLGRLAAWSNHWSQLSDAIRRDCHVPLGWKVKPWIFIPKAHEDLFNRKLTAIKAAQHALGVMPEPQVTHLEKVVPWNYPSWNRKLEAAEDEA